MTKWIKFIFTKKPKRTLSNAMDAWDKAGGVEGQNKRDKAKREKTQ